MMLHFIVFFSHLNCFLSLHQGTDRTLVFVESKRGADFLAVLLSGEGFPTTSIHG